MPMQFRVLFMLFFLIHCNKADETSWIKSGYWLTVSSFPIPDIESSLFTHLTCGFATINSTTYELSFQFLDLQYIASFSATVKHKNPAIKTLLSIGDARITPTFLSMISNSSSRRSFINSAIKAAIKYGFNGLDLFYFQPNTTLDSLNMEALFDELKKAVDSYDKTMIITMGINYLPISTSVVYDYYLNNNSVVVNYPVHAIQRNFDWVHMFSFDYFMPRKDNFVHPHASLYDPYNPHINTNYGISQWVSKGLAANKILIGLPYHGWAWTLMNQQDSQVGAMASGPGINANGSVSYKYLKDYVKSYGAKIVYNSTYVENFCSFGSFWVCFDDVEAIKTKVVYAREKGLRGYSVFQVPNDDNWVLSRAAAGIPGRNHLKRSFAFKVVVPVACAFCLISLALFLLRSRLLNCARYVSTESKNFRYDSPDIKIFRFEDINIATNKFSSHQKLGEGGYGPVYKGKLKSGHEIAVKRLSKASSQGFEEFKNEVMLTARLQHVNLVKLVGFCVEREEKMLIYEYLPNRSLDSYLFDPVLRLQLDWRKRTHIIEGIIQGLLYLQEYSRLTVIHRDLKASNILLDKDLNPKISDFGLARIFHSDLYEANTSRIVGTYGYVPPEYVKQGLYSRKYDVFSFGVLLLQVISGKTHSQFYGADEDVNLLQYAYELWIEGQGVEFVDPALDDSSSECKLMRCLQIALLCVQEEQEERPSMLEVSYMLTNETGPIKIPKRPAFSTKPDEDEKQEVCSENLKYSNNDSVVSELEPR